MNPGRGRCLGLYRTTFQTWISRERNEQIEIWLDFQKVEREYFQTGLSQILPIATPSPRKFAPKIGFEQFWNLVKNREFPYFQKSFQWIFLIFCVMVDVNSGLILVKTACLAKVRFSQNLGKSVKFGKIVCVFKHLYLKNQKSKSKSDSMFTMCKLQIFSNVGFILPVSLPLTPKI